MKTKFAVLACVMTGAIGAAIGSLAVAGGDAHKAPDHKGSAPEMKLPAGWTMEDMQACMDAGTLGDMHKELAKGTGQWTGKTTQWMAPGADPVYSECTNTVTMVMDGRFQKCEFNGEMPGMGPFTGLGYQGYDNVSKKFVSTWMDNMGTGIMFGTGERSADGKAITWTYTANCPLTKKPTTMREVQRFLGDKSMTMEMHCTDPKTGKEFKCMEIELTRK